MSLNDLRPGLRAYLLADAAISTAVGGSRIFPVMMPQGERGASIVYTRVSGIGDHHMQGASGLSRPRYQIDAYAVLHDDANALADLVKLRLDGYQGLMGAVMVQGCFFENERDDYQADVDLHRVSRDYTELGNGTIDYTKIWPDIPLAGMKHFFVEQGGNFAHDSMRSVADCAEYVTRVLLK